MNIKQHSIAAVAWALAAGLALSGPVLAQSETSPSVSDKFEKSVWDFSTALLPQDLIEGLKAVRQTHELIESQNARPDIIVVFRSVSSRQVAQTEKRQAMVSPALVEESRALLQELADLRGVRLETDARSLELLQEDYRQLISLIDDVYLALISYQARDYSLVTVYPIPGMR